MHMHTACHVYMVVLAKPYKPSWSSRAWKTFAQTLQVNFGELLSNAKMQTTTQLPTFFWFLNTIALAVEINTEYYDCL